MDELTVKTAEYDSASRATLRDAVMPLFRRRRLATIIFLGVFVGALLGGLLAPREYEAEMKILVNRSRVDAVVTPDADAQPTVAVPEVSEEDLNSEVELLKSRDLLEQVVLAYSLESPDGARFERLGEHVRRALGVAEPTQDARVARSVQELEDRLVVDPLKKTALIRVTYAARNPQQAAQVLQTLATLYEEKHAAVHRSPGTFSFFDQETDRYRTELAAAEARLTSFDAKESVVAPAEQEQLVLQHLSQFEADLHADEASAYAARTRARALESQSIAMPERQTTQMRRLDNAQLLADLESTLLSLELKDREMLIKYAPTYPPVKEVEAQIADTRRAISAAEQSPVEEITTDRVPARDWMATELAKADADRAQFEGQAAATERVVQRYQQTAEQLDRKGTVQEDLMRDVKSAKDNYLLYVRKREEARISDALDSKRIVNVSMAEAATVPAFPTSHFGWALVGGLFAAGATSIGAAYAADRLDPSFRNPEELGRYLDVKVLASIPDSKERS
jgi:uncharacterized protein involved in exopolysaccharide biosynthesis